METKWCVVYCLCFYILKAFSHPSSTTPPRDVIKELQSFRSQIKIEINPCSRIAPVDVKFSFYTRNHSELLSFSTPLKKHASKNFEARKKTIMLIHGWMAGLHDLTPLKEAYLRRYDANVLMVDWTSASRQLYSSAYCHSAKIANSVSKFLCGSDVVVEDLHVVGHSMGAQIAGYAGQLAKIKCKREIGRITGLDPAGYLYQDLPERRRLDKSAAKFVDVIHTDQLYLGYIGNMGHVDFYPNCGLVQPGCRVGDVNNDTTTDELFCSHHRSLQYMTESVFSNDFVGVSCGLCPRYCRPSLINEVYAVMGEDCRKPTTSSTKFYLKTNRDSPFAAGWKLQDAKLP